MQNLIFFNDNFNFFFMKQRFISTVKLIDTIVDLTQILIGCLKISILFNIRKKYIYSSIIY